MYLKFCPVPIRDTPRTRRTAKIEDETQRKEKKEDKQEKSSRRNVVGMYANVMNKTDANVTIKGEVPRENENTRKEITNIHK